MKRNDPRCLPLSWLRQTAPFVGIALVSIPQNRLEPLRSAGNILHPAVVTEAVEYSSDNLLHPDQRKVQKLGAVTSKVRTHFTANLDAARWNAAGHADSKKYSKQYVWLSL